MYSKKGSQNDRVEEFGEYILSKTVKSVHRTYFLDVRATKGEDLFVTITESRKRQNPDGTQYYDRHKIVLYKEDIYRFCEEFGIIEEFLKEQRPRYFEKSVESSVVDAQQSPEVVAPAELENATEPELEVSIESDIKFEDL
jgi:hypothetical protein